DFPAVFTCARDGTATFDPERPGTDLIPLLETILATIPEASGDEGAPMRLQVSSIEHNEYVGRLAIGRVLAGTIRNRQPVGVLHPDEPREEGTIGRLYTFEGLRREEAASARAGDIVAIAGFPEIRIGDTIAEGEDAEALPPTAIDEPTLSMVLRVNDGPFSGQDGAYLTSRHLRERLEREMRRNVAMRLEDADEPDAMRVSGRGLLHLSILIENMRREGYEFAVSNPQAIYHEENGQRLEPMELLTVDAAEDIAGRVIEIVGQRRGRLEHMEKRGDRMHLEFLIPARGLLGLRNRVLSAARGEAILYHVFSDYEPYKGPIANRLQGVLIASETGVATAYAFRDLQERGRLFVEPGTRVYRGMIVGEHSRETDLTVNICRKRHVSNVRQSTSEKNVPLDAVVAFNLEEALEYVREDELVEVTPKAIRLRKRFLDEDERKRRARQDALGPASAGGRPRAGSLR
ncbi:MAG: translational GTPase TypA, partial [Planctomycetes bacterium]|nr:translational GTPase TypA [Planctomycetota bacterium]